MKYRIVKKVSTGKFKIERYSENMMGTKIWFTYTDVGWNYIFLPGKIIWFDTLEEAKRKVNELIEERKQEEYEAKEEIVFEIDSDEDNQS